MKSIFAAVMLLMLAVVAGCGSDGHGHEAFHVETFSDASQDSDIMRDQAGNLTVTNVEADRVTSVFAGLDPATADEFRAFLDFPLDIVPANASIDFAAIRLFIRDVIATGGGVRLRVELVDFTPPLLATYFFRDVLPPVTPVAFTVATVFPGDIGHDVEIDVSSLMDEAQGRGFSNLQLRIGLEPTSSFPGVIEIDETPQTPPLLAVQYQ